MVFTGFIVNLYNRERSQREQRIKRSGVQGGVLVTSEYQLTSCETLISDDGFMSKALDKTLLKQLGSNDKMELQ